MAYERVNWENLPSKNTPVNADNLNKMDEGIANIDTKINAKQDKLTAGTGIEITDENIINNIQGNYSTEEVKIGTWIDGKPLYRKVFNFGQLPVTSRKEINHGISNLNRITKLYGIASWNSADIPTIPLPSADPDGEKYSVYLSANSSIIAVTTGSDRGAFYGYVVMEYTKK